MPRLTLERRQLLLDLIEKKWHPKAIAKEVGCSVMSVYRYMGDPLRQRFVAASSNAQRADGPTKESQYRSSHKKPKATKRERLYPKLGLGITLGMLSRRR